jgi:hypothetical protein
MRAVRWRFGCPDARVSGGGGEFKSPGRWGRARRGGVGDAEMAETMDDGSLFRQYVLLLRVKESD